MSTFDLISPAIPTVLRYDIRVQVHIIRLQARFKTNRGPHRFIGPRNSGEGEEGTTLPGSRITLYLLPFTWFMKQHSMNCFQQGEEAMYPSSAPLAARPSGSSLNPRWGAPQRESRPTQRPHLTRRVPAATAPAFPPVYLLTRALGTRAHSYLKHWLM